MKSHFFTMIKPVFIGLSSIVFSHAVMAVELTTSGFFSIIAGNVLGGDKGDYLQNVSGYECPCFIADYASAGVYEGVGWDLAPDSRAGLQLDAAFNDRLSLSSQLVGHGGNNMKPELSAFYLSWELTESAQVKVGRQRLPLFYYSDFFDVGYAYTWIRVPADLYGWPISSYNGASLAYEDDLGNGSYRLSVLVGEEEDHKDLMNSDIYYVSRDFETEWKNMVSASASYIYDWFDVRAVYMTNKTFSEANYGAAGGGRYTVYDNIHQHFYGFSFNVDFHNVIIKSEGNMFKLPKVDFASWAKMLAVGYRMGSVTPMLTYSRYDDVDPDFGRSHFRTRSATVRWDFMKNTAFKMQYDIIDDQMDWPGYSGFNGDTRTVSAGVDYVF